LNIKLASMLTGYVIDVYRDTEEADEEDIFLDEFKDEIDAWVIDAIKESTGAMTAKGVLKLSREELIEKADLEESTADNVIRVLKSEFEDDEPTADNTDDEIPADTEEEEEPQA